MNLPFSLIPANTSLKLHIIRKTASIDNIIVAHSIRHFKYNKRKKHDCSQWRLLVFKRAYFIDDGSYCCPLIHGFHIHVHLQKQIETKFKKKGLVFPYSYRWCLTAKLMNCFLQALQCFSDLHQLGLYLIFLLRGILVWGGGILIGFLP